MLIIEVFPELPSTYMPDFLRDLKRRTLQSAIYWNSQNMSCLKFVMLAGLHTVMDCL